MSQVHGIPANIRTTEQSCRVSAMTLRCIEWASTLCRKDRGPLAPALLFYRVRLTSGLLDGRLNTAFGGQRQQWGSARPYGRVFQGSDMIGRNRGRDSPVPPGVSFLAPDVGRSADACIVSPRDRFQVTS
jgi:hypothetical protein